MVFTDEKMQLGKLSAGCCLFAFEKINTMIMRLRPFLSNIGRYYIYKKIGTLVSQIRKFGTININNHKTSL